jgi:hypothetical protein
LRPTRRGRRCCPKGRADCEGTGGLASSAGPQHSRSVKGFPPRPASLAYPADLLGRFLRAVVENNVSVTMFPQKDFICDG